MQQTAGYRSFGLALGPGALRGLSHIGVLQVLEENGMVPSYVAGNSIGAIVGGLYAAGMTPKEMARMCGLLDRRAVYDHNLRRNGLMSGNRLQNLIKTLSRDINIEDTRIPFGVCAVDLGQGELVYLRDGPLHVAVRASASIPGVFSPVEANGRLLVDGGLIIGVPGQLCRRMGADVVIGVDVAVKNGRSQLRNAMEIGIRSLLLLQYELYRHQDSGVDCMITPAVEDCYALRWDNVAECIQRGRQAAEAALPMLRCLLAAPPCVPSAEAYPGRSVDAPGSRGG